MKIEMLSPSELIPYKNNPRKNEQAIDKVATSISEFGFKQPIVVDKDNTIVVGHTRWKAALKLGLKEVPVIRATDLTPEQARSYRIADNKTNEFAEWDWEGLGLELDELKDLDIDLDWLEFDENNFPARINEGLTDDDAIPENVEPICKTGDLYKLGEHRLLCGDCLDIENIDKLLDGKTANVLITDPPYGVDYSSKNDFLNKYDEGNRNQTAIKNDAIESYKDFFTTFLINLKDKFDNTFYVFISGKEISNLIQAIQDCSYHFSQEIVWVKNNHVLGRMDYQPKHENIVYGWQNTHKFFGGFQTSVIEYPKPLKSDLHPTMKPVELLSKLIQDSTLMNNIVIDLFGGSGSTLIACEKLNRKCYMMEIDPYYCDVIIKRWEDFTGKKAELVNA